MDDEVDSLEHIMALVSPSNQTDPKRNNPDMRNMRNPQPLEEPSYRILPSSDNHASSFGAGGTISQVVDPHFRPPAPQNPHTFGQRLGTTNMSTNIMSSTLLDYGPPVTVASFNNVNNGFNFAAQQPPPPPPPPTHDHHHHHHHNPFLPPSGRPITIDSSRNSANEPFRPPYVSGPPVQRFIPGNEMPMVSATSAPTVRPIYLNPTNQTINQTQISFTPSTSQNIRQASNAYVTQTNDGPFYSPKPKNPSPPLDQINMPIITAPNITATTNSNIRVNPNPSLSLNSKGDTNSNSNLNKTPTIANIISSINKPASVGEALGRIPKKKAIVSDRYNDMSMLVLQEKYRECESRLDANKLRRQGIEKTLGDMARNSHGKNIELDPHFRQKKDEQRQCDDVSQEIRAKMKKISEKLSTKFNHKIVPRTGKPSQMSTNRPPPKRAKMSTAAHIERERSPLDGKKRLMFRMGESKVWCKTCDIHFESFGKYCEHLHKKDHLRAMKQTEPPWNKIKDKVDSAKTFDMMKSICARVSNEVDSDFSISRLAKLLNPTGTDEKTLKNMNLERERGRFDKEDPLLHIKGYENLIPITGYFCQLCDRAYCDYTAIEQHVKSYEHNYRYAVSVANDEASGKTFRELQEKSYKRQHPDKEKAAISLPPTSSRQASATTTEPSSSRAITAPPITQYKKPTSHIVDEHEVVVKKFPSAIQPERRASSKQRSDNSTALARSDDSTALSKSKRILESDESEDEAPPSPKTYSKPSEEHPISPKKFVKNRMPDIVPISDSRSRPSALKQLRNEKLPKPIKKPYISSTDSDTSESDSPALNTGQLRAGEPDSPFPDLILTVTGNTHMNVLKDKRLSQFCTVKMNRIIIDDYKDMLMDKTTLWTRITHLMAKKEGENLNLLSEQLRKKPKTKPTYFTASGSTVPIDLDKDATKDKPNGNDDDSDLDEKPQLSGLVKAGKDSGQNTKNTEKSAEIRIDSDDEDLNAEIDNGTNKKFSMGWLETFFCEK